MKLSNIFISIMTLSYLSLIVAEATADVKTFTIKEAVSEVFTMNPQISELENRIISARKSVYRAKTDFLPRASMTYSYNSLKDKPISKQGGQNVQMGHQDQYHWDVNLVQPLFTGFALKSNLEIDKLDLNIRLIEKEQKYMDLSKDIKSACYRLLLARKIFKVAEEEVEALVSHRDEAMQYYKQGLIPRNDLLKSEVMLSSARQEKEKDGASAASAMAFVNMLMNAPLERPIIIVDIPDKPMQKRFDYETLAAEAKKNRPELAILLSRLNQAKIGKTLARSAYYPSVSMIGRYERNGDAPNMSDNDYGNDHNSSITLQAEWTFFEWGKTKADVFKAVHEKRALEEAIQTVGNSICLEVKNALLDLNVAGKNILTAKNSLEQAEENWRITKAQYAEQICTSTDVLDARTFLTGADSNYFGALYGYMISLAELDRAVGRK